MITLVVCHDVLGGIGKDGEMPWGMSLKDDLEHFRKLTEGHAIIIGRKTFESIGKLLPNRSHYLVTSDEDYENQFSVEDPVNVFSNVEDVLLIYNSIRELFFELTGDEYEVFVVGGQTIYEQFLPYADRVIKSVIYDKSFDCDTFFPHLSTFGTWKGKTLRVFPKNERNAYGFYISEYLRVWGEEDGKEETTSVFNSD